MKKLYFITGNHNKLNEIKSIIPYVESLNLDLPEIQENSSEKIIKEKLKEAQKVYSDLEFIVEDTSLHFDSLNGLPGPLIKWFLEKNSLQELYNICDKLKNYKAQAKTIIGYKSKENKYYFFEGIVSGTIVKPKVESNFGWDPIFKPDGFDKSFGEMTREEKNKISMRKIAAKKLNGFLEKESS